MSPEASPSLGQRALRSAGLGLFAGMLLGGGLLLFLGLRALLAPPDCTRLRPPECELLTQTALEVGRFQLLSGGALVALALATAVLLRPAFGPRQGPPPP